MSVSQNNSDDKYKIVKSLDTKEKLLKDQKNEHLAEFKKLSDIENDKN